MRSTLFVVMGLVGCVDGSGERELELAQGDSVLVASDGAADAPSWETAETLHANAPIHAYADAQARHVHSLWIAGSESAPQQMTITATAGEGYDVRIAVLGPIVNGARPVLAADGYGSAERTPAVTFDATQSGEHLVVVGSHGLARDTYYELAASCDSCESRVDVLATPKDFGLVGDAHGLVQMQLGDVVQGLGVDIEVELWTSPPMQSWNAEHVATSVASGSQVNVIVPSSVNAGDDLRLVVREAGGRILDSGVVTRYSPSAASMVRLDAILYGDIASLQIGGIVGFYEGIADLRLRSEARGIELARDTQHVSHPGQVGNGLNAFDATFLPELPTAATDGELLSIGFINGNGDYRRLGCFEYCNNLSGLSSCTGGPRGCP